MRKNYSIKLVWLHRRCHAGRRSGQGRGLVHVDGSKRPLGWARDNAELSGLKADKPVRWILEDAAELC